MNYNKENEIFMSNIENLLRENKVGMGYGFHYLIKQNIDIFEKEHYAHDQEYEMTYRGHNNPNLDFVGVINIKYSKYLSYIIRLNKEFVEPVNIYEQEGYYKPCVVIDRHERMELKESDLNDVYLESLFRDWMKQTEEELEVKFINSQIEMYQNLISNTLKGDKNE